MKTPVFTTWHDGYRQFLAIPFLTPAHKGKPESFRIIDDTGKDFGYWTSLDNFKKHCADKGPLTLLHAQHSTLTVVPSS